MKQTIKKHVSKIQTQCSNCLASTASSVLFFGPFCHLLYDSGLKLAEAVQLQAEVFRKSAVHPFYGKPKALTLIEALHYFAVQRLYIHAFQGLYAIGLHYMFADLPQVALEDVPVDGVIDVQQGSSVGRGKLQYRTETVA